MPSWLACTRILPAVRYRLSLSLPSSSTASLASYNGSPFSLSQSFVRQPPRQLSCRLLSTSLAPSARPPGMSKGKGKGKPKTKARSSGPFYSPPRSIRHRAPPSRKEARAPVVYTHTRLKIAIVGRPNVGKSTLFNRLASAVRGRGHEGVANPSPLVFVRSVVDSVPGVTRDPREASGALSDLLMTVVDTPGLENAIGQASPSIIENDKSKSVNTPLVAAVANCDNPIYRDMYHQMEQKTVEAVQDADIVFLVVDSGDGVTIVDRAIATWLRSAISSQPKEVVVVANKCDLKDSESRIVDAYELGFDDPVVLSAEQGLGFADLYARIDSINERKRLAQSSPTAVHTGYNNPWKREADGCGLEEVDDEHEAERASFDDELVVGYADRPGEEPLRQLVVSIIGRPNVGKSTLLNRLAGEERSLVGPEAGVTRDAVLCEWKLPNGWRSPKRSNDIPFWLVDTAGVRAQTKVLDEKLESLSVQTSLRALRHSHVVLMVVDAREPLVSQDTKLLDLVVTHGRAVVLVINKMDKVKSSNDELNEWRKQLRYRIDSKLANVAGIEMVEISAKNWDFENHSQMKPLFEAVVRAWHRWEKRIPTAQLNRFVQKFNERMAVGGGTKGAKRNRKGTTKFISQKKIRPPMFRLDGSSAVSMNYLRGLTNAIRLEFGFHGVPIRVKRPSRGRRK